MPTGCACLKPANKSRRPEMSLLINIAGVALIALIVWWFWLWRPKALAQVQRGVVEILVDQGVYSPARIEIPAGQPTTLRFVRKDPSPCAEQVLFDQLGLSTELPMNKPRDVVVKPNQPGRYEFSCQRSEEHTSELQSRE